MSPGGRELTPADRRDAAVIALLCAVFMLLRWKKMGRCYGSILRAGCTNSRASHAASCRIAISPFNILLSRRFCTHGRLRWLALRSPPRRSLRMSSAYWW